jgi:hypothetical protein
LTADELGESLEDVKKVLKPQYASPEISGDENGEKVFYICKVPWRNQRVRFDIFSHSSQILNLISFLFCSLASFLKDLMKKKNECLSDKKNTSEIHSQHALKWMKTMNFIVI